MVVIVILHKGEIVIMGVAAIAEADARYKFVRLGNLIHGFEIPAAIDGVSVPAGNQIRTYS
jgi:hypothetical protein